MNEPGELEQRLRALFADDRLTVEPADDAAAVIVAGARRRRRRQRALTSAAGAACALAVVSAGLAVVQLRGEHATADLSSRAVSAPTPLASSPVPEPTSSAASSAEQAPVEPSDTEESDLPVPPARPPRHSTPVPTSQPTSKVVAGTLVTADGLGAVKLGMTEKQLTDQGVQLTPVKESGSCTYYDVAGAGVPAATAVVSADKGVVSVKPDGAAHTPEGVGDGSLKDQVTSTYPGTSESSSELVSPTGDQGAYHFTLNSDGAVQGVEVRAKAQDCAG
ncbi:hypothetical protein [Amycolatopsis benzoatilytica]|uniref:hypothetical protein n=1 Tax=Amycolatopsis benzoatilytica TaxID=346045 RepID=UPI0003607518|nr:hypothetical protein [Amycolatopsis benzoatilytica]